MIRIFLAVTLLYLLFLLCYFVWEWQSKQKQNAARNKVSNLFKPSPKEDIIGKSTFSLRHSLPDATTLIINKKGKEKPLIFVPENAKGETQSVPKVVPPSELNRVFSSVSTENDDNEIIIDYNPKPEDEPDDNDGEIDEDEIEDAGVPTGAGVATGLGFNELAGMLRTVESVEIADSEEKEEAGRVLVDVRKTDMFEQVVSGSPKKKTIVSQLMDEYFAAFYRNHSEAHPESTVKAPADFDIRAFA